VNCPVCGAPRPVNPWITGKWTDMHGTPVAVAYRCVPPCTNNRDIPWAAASESQRQQADLAQLSLDAASEMMMAPTR
jgi:hypothetical protein